MFPALEYPTNAESNELLGFLIGGNDSAVTRGTRGRRGLVKQNLPALDLSQLLVAHGARDVLVPAPQRELRFFMIEQ